MSETSERKALRIGATEISLFVAALSLCTAMYQGYLNTRAVNVFSQDVMYRETMRACREAVDAFMEARLRIQRLADAKMSTAPENLEERTFEAKRTVARFAAVATYLANFNEEKFRRRYTDLALHLEGIVEETRNRGREAVDLKKADEEFKRLNTDCVSSVRKP